MWVSAGGSLSGDPCWEDTEKRDDALDSRLEATVVGRGTSATAEMGGRSVPSGL